MDLSEIGNPKKTAARRMEEAENPKPPAAPASAPGMSQADFTKKGGAVDPKKNSKFIELMRRHTAP